MNTVPFWFGGIDVWAGFGMGEGLLHHEGTEICLEYQLKDGFVGAIKTGLKKVRVPLKDLVTVILEKAPSGQKWAGDKIAIQASHMDPLQDVPGASLGRITLWIASKDH